MSIIYDALQKTQTNRSNKPTSKLKKIFRNSQWVDIGMLIVIITLFIIVLFAYYPHISSYLTSKHTTTKQPLAPVQPVMAKAAEPQTIRTQFATGNYGKITLNGVFLSDQDKFAMLNNQTYHLGDTIEGMTIVKIDFDKVELHTEKMHLVLRTTA